MALNRREDVLEQYRDSSNLAARVDLHKRYNTNPEAWPSWVFDHVAERARGEILEVGCGPGSLWRTLLERIPDDWHITATDMSLGMVEEARDLLRDERFTTAVADAASLPFVDASFDTVVANHMLYHVPDVDAALREFARVLVAGGALVAATNGEEHFQEVRGLFPRGAGRWGHIKAFGLETGPPMVARHFDDVRVDRHPAVLEVPETEPIVRYITSMPSSLRSKQIQEIREQIDEVIAREGVFRVTTDAGIITARKG